MSRGKGVRLQRYKDGGLMDVRSYGPDGLFFHDKAGRQKPFADTIPHIGVRGQAGRMAPRGFNSKPVFGFDKSL